GPVLDAIGGESLTAFATARQILAERTGRALHRRTRDITRGEGRAFWLPPADVPEPDVSAGIAEGGEEEPPAARDRVQAGAWLDGLGMYGKLDGDTGEAEVHTLLYGGTLGADAWIAEHVLIGLAAGYALRPVAGFDWLRLTEESYTESGAGSLSLTVDPKDLDTTVARFGARVFGRVSMGAQGVLLPELRAFWQAAYGDRERVLNAR